MYFFIAYPTFRFASSLATRSYASWSLRPWLPTYPRTCTSSLRRPSPSASIWSGTGRTRTPSSGSFSSSPGSTVWAGALSFSHPSSLSYFRCCGSVRVHFSAYPDPAPRIRTTDFVRNRGFSCFFCLMEGSGSVQIVLRIRIYMFWGVLDPDLLVRGMDPDPSNIMQKW